MSLRRDSRAEQIVNGMSVDVEDYFHVSAFAQSVDRRRWDRLESRVCRNTDRLLEIFEGAGVTATFFVLGWVADRYPALVRRISSAGHELGSHGYAHRLVFDQTPHEFREDLRRARGAIEAASGSWVSGYRAPSYSITNRSRWALDILVEEGYEYDASIFPIHHDRYGIPDAPRHPHLLSCATGQLWEVPTATIRVGGVNLPVGGGGYFRLLPYQWTRWGIGRLNAIEGRPAIFYLHPWEIDSAQPRMPSGALTGLRHYFNLGKTDARLQRLLQDFRFGTIRSLLEREAAVACSSPLGTGIIVSAPRGVVTAR